MGRVSRTPLPVLLSRLSLGSRAALVANALAPPRGFRTGVAASGPGWLTSELAPHLLVATAVESVAHVAWARRRGRAVDPWVVAFGGASAGGLVRLVQEGQQARQVVDDALIDGLGPDWGDDVPEPPEGTDLDRPWRQLVFPFRLRSDGVRVLRDLRYSTAGKRGLLDLYLPEGEVHDAPVLLQVHGGAWSLGDKDHQGVPLMLHMASKGWICVAINYRLAPRDPFPAQIIDVKRALSWIRREIARYGGDPSYVAITGGSAGGHLASLAALTPHEKAWQPGFEDDDTSVSVAVPHYGVYDLAGASGARNAARLRDDFLGPKVFQSNAHDGLDAFEEASPLLRVGDEAPDFFVLHGARDSLVPVRQAHEFVARLRERSRATVAYAELPGAQHGFDVVPSIRSAHVVRAIDRYLRWHHATHHATHHTTHRATPR